MLKNLSNGIWIIKFDVLKYLFPIRHVENLLADCLPHFELYDIKMAYETFHPLLDRDLQLFYERRGLDDNIKRGSIGLKVVVKNKYIQ